MSRPVAFVTVNVEEGPANADGVSLRFKVAGDERVVREIAYESEDGIDGRWCVFAASNADATERSDARAMLVEDSSDGVAWLIVGGAHGLVLEHIETSVTIREAYLMLSKTTVLTP